MKSRDHLQTQTFARRPSVSGALLALLACAGITLIALPLRGLLNPANLLVLYLLPVLWISASRGWLPGVLAAVLGVLAYDVFLVPPYYSIRVEDTQYLISLLILFAVALVVGRLTAQLKQEAHEAAQRETRTRALFNLALDLLAAQDVQAAMQIVDRHSQQLWNCRTQFLLPDEGGHLQCADAARPPSPMALAAAQALMDAAAHGKILPELSTTADACLIPLRSAGAWRGVLLLSQASRACPVLGPTEFATAWAALISLALDRIHYAALAQQASMAAESEALRNAILAAVSHDLRTPIASLAGLAGALVEQQSVDAHSMELCRAIEDEALRMDDMAGNLLQLARLQSGAPLDPQLQMLEEAVGPALKHVERALARHDLQIEIPAGLPLLRFDAVLIERVLCNLLSNAAHQAPTASRIRLSARELAEGVEVRVEDQGPGMAPQALARLLRDEDAPGGSGLGLWICQRILRAHGSSLQAEALEAGGMCFRFVLPRPKPGELKGALS